MLWLGAVEAISARFGSGATLPGLVEAQQQRPLEPAARRSVARS